MTTLASQAVKIDLMGSTESSKAPSPCALDTLSISDASIDDYTNETNDQLVGFEKITYLHEGGQEKVKQQKKNLV